MQLQGCFPNLDYCFKMKTKYGSRFYYTLRHGEDWMLITESNQFSTPYKDLCTLTTFRLMMLGQYEEDLTLENEDMLT